jgi:uncharacterized protein (DUF1499 family)
MTPHDHPPAPAPDRLARAATIVTGAGLALAGLAALALLLSAVGSRWDWWSFRTGFALLRAVLVGGLLVVVLVLTGLVLGLLARSGRALLLSGASLLVLAVTAAPPVGHLRAVGRVPPIHDITTDLDDPPRFVAVLPLRRGAPNPAEHAGAALAAQQRAGYPDLGPARFAAPPDTVFARAVEVARGFGWEIVAAAPAEGRLEATARTRWFGFRDDVVVRVKADGAGTRVDVRSVSRVGRSDLGTNARRIHRFLAALRAKIETR